MTKYLQKIKLLTFPWAAAVLSAVLISCWVHAHFTLHSWSLKISPQGPFSFPVMSGKCKCSSSHVFRPIKGVHITFIIYVLLLYTFTLLFGTLSYFTVQILSSNLHFYIKIYTNLSLNHKPRNCNTETVTLWQTLVTGIIQINVLCAARETNNKLQQDNKMKENIP